MARHRIALCMGSSCFVRGNQRHAPGIAAWVRTHGIDAQVTAHRCQDRCGQGPLISIDGHEMHIIDDDDLERRLRDTLEGI